MTGNERAKKWLADNMPELGHLSVESLAKLIEQVRAEGENAGLEGWREWVGSVRKKFNLPDTPPDGPRGSEAEFWRGYGSALQDVEIQAAKSPVAQGEAINALPISSEEQS